MYSAKTNQPCHSKFVVLKRVFFFKGSKMYNATCVCECVLLKTCVSMIAISSQITCSCKIYLNCHNLFTSNHKVSGSFQQSVTACHCLFISFYTCTVCIFCILHFHFVLDACQTMFRPQSQSWSLYKWFHIWLIK